MLDFLKELGIEDKTIDILNNKYYDNILYSLTCNEYEINKIIDYFNNVGITCIDELLINHIDLFLETKENIENSFNKYDMNILIPTLNSNPQVIRNII